MSLPQVLQTAGDRLRDAQAAWLLVQQAGLGGDETVLRQYASETERAVKDAAALLDEWFTFGDTPHMSPDDADWGPF